MPKPSFVKSGFCFLSLTIVIFIVISLALIRRLIILFFAPRSKRTHVSCLLPHTKTGYPRRLRHHVLHRQATENTFRVAKLFVAFSHATPIVFSFRGDLVCASATRPGKSPRAFRRPRTHRPQNASHRLKPRPDYPCRHATGGDLRNEGYRFFRFVCLKAPACRHPFAVSRLRPFSARS